MVFFNKQKSDTFIAASYPIQVLKLFNYDLLGISNSRWKYLQLQTSLSVHYVSTILGNHDFLN